LITEKELRIAAASYLSALGYYVEVLPEVPTYPVRPDVVGILPRLKDLKEREKLGPPPAGLLYLLLEKDWLSLNKIVNVTGYEEGFIGSVLLEGEAKGWIQSRVNEDGTMEWALGEYRVPVKECLMFFTGVGDAAAALQALEDLKGCYNRGFILFPYQITIDFMDSCFDKGIGILRYYENIAYFDHVLQPEWQPVATDRRYLTLCEKILHDNRHFREEEGI
jgi:hypothetical protein